jgi:hypothetical protein
VLGATSTAVGAGGGAASGLEDRVWGEAESGCGGGAASGLEDRVWGEAESGRGGGAASGLEEGGRGEAESGRGGGVEGLDPVGGCGTFSGSTLVAASCMTLESSSTASTSCGPSSPALDLRSLRVLWPR